MKTWMLAAVLVAATARADVLWTGDPAQGTKVFKLLNIEGGGTVSVVPDPDYGSAFKFYKPAGSNRCESSHCAGWQGKEGDVIFIGWRFKVDMPKDLTPNAVWQWHSYPTSHIQNYPMIVKPVNGTLWLEQFNPDGTKGLPKTGATENVLNNLWGTPFVPMQWYTVVLSIKISADIKQGYVEWWYNGQPQTLRSGGTRFPCRTWDGDYSDPKWGVYGAQGSVVTNYVTSLKIATTYEEAAPSGSVSIAPPARALPGGAAILFPRIFDLTGRRLSGDSRAHVVSRGRDELRIFAPPD